MVRPVHEARSLVTKMVRAMLVTGAIALFAGGAAVVVSSEWMVSAGAAVMPQCAPNCTGSNLSNTDLSGLNLSNVDFSGANLTSANFSNANLSGATLYGAVLNSANFSNANLTGVNLSNSSLINANLSTATIASVDMSYSAISQIRLPATVTKLNARGVHWCLSRSFSISTRQWSGSCYDYNLAQTLPTGWKSFDNGQLLDSTFLVGPGADLYGVDLTGRNMSAVLPNNDNDLSGRNLSGVSLTNVSSGFLRACPTSLPTNWVCRSVGTKSGFTAKDGTSNDYWLLGPGANLSSQNFTTLTNPTLNSANLSGADLSGANLSGTNFSSATLTSVNLSNAILTGSNLTSANLTSATFSNTKIAYATITNAIFSSTSPANLITGGLLGSGATLPSGWTVNRGYLFGPGASLAGLTLTGTSTSPIDLSSVNLSGANLKNALFTNVNFTNANLSSAILTNANLSSVNLSGANLSSASASGIKGESISYNSSTTFPSSGWKVGNGVLIGPGADVKNAGLTFVDFSNVNLTGTTLTGANVSGANFTNATLTDVVSGSLQVAAQQYMPTLPSGWSLVKGYLIGPGANLTNLSVSPPTTLIKTTALSASSTSLTVASASGFTQSGTFAIQIDSEIMTVTAGAGSTTWTISRGQSGTTAAPHAISAQVVQTTGIDLSNSNLTGANLTGASLAYANLSGANLTNAKLTGANLTGAKMSSTTNLSGTVLAGTTLSGANLTGANLSGVVLTSTVGSTTTSGVNLSGATLTSANLGSLNLASSSLSGARSGSITGSPTLPSSWFINTGYLVGPSANLSGLDLTGMSFQGRSGLNGLNFKNSTLTNVNFSNTSLVGVILTGSTITNTNFNGANLTGIISGSITTSPAPTLPTGWSLTSGYLIGPGANLTGASLSGVNLTDRALNTVNLSNATLTNAILTRTNLTSAVLTGATLTGATLTSASLKNANVTSADFTNATLTSASFLGATITSAIFTGATLSQVASNSVVSTANPTFPSGWGLVAGSIVGPNADLTNANLANANLTGYNLSSATLTGVKSGSITGSPTLPTGYSKINGYIVGPGVNLTNANLANQNLGSLSLNGTILTGASLGGANLSANTLTGVITGSLTSTPTLPTNFSVTGGYIVGPGANLTNADLGTANLSNVNLTGATLAGTILTNTTLTNIKSGSVVGNPLLPTGWKTINGYLVGRGANLTSASLDGANLNGLDLTGTNFSNATLRGANLTSANLTTANMSGANIGPISVTTTLSSSVTDSVTTITVASASGFPASGSYIIVIDNENLLVTVGNSTTTWTVRRAQYGTAGAAHSSGATVTLRRAGAVLTGATMTGTNLSNATLTSVVSGSISISGTQPSLPSSWALTQGGFLVGPGADLSGTKMTNLNLSGVNFSSVLLIGTDLTNSVMTNVNLTNATMTNAVLTGVNLTGATFTGLATGGMSGSPTLPSGYVLVNGFILGSNLDLRGAILGNTNVGSVNLTGSNLSGSNLNGVTIASSANLTNVNFSNALLRNSTLTGTDLSSANLSGANLYGANLRSATLGSSTTLSGTTNFSNANLNGANLTGLNLSLVGSTNLTGLKSGSISGSPTLPSGWWKTPSNGYLVGPNANLSGASFEGVSFTSPNFTSVDLGGANFYGAVLNSANFASADLTGVNFQNSSLISADLSSATVASVDMSYAAISQIKLPAAVTKLYTRGIHTCTTMTFSMSTKTWDGNCYGWNNTLQLPTGWQRFDAGKLDDGTTLVGPGAGLYGVDLSRWNLSSLSLDNVSSGYLKACPSATSLPTDWVCTSVGTKSGYTASDGTSNNYWLLGPGVDLSGQDFTTLSNPTLNSRNLTNANLAGSDFSTTSFNYTNLSGTKLENTNLSNASLYRTYVNGLTGKRNVTLPSGYSVMTRPSNVTNGPAYTIVGPGISLWYFNLSNWDLSSKNLSGAELQGVNFTSTNLSGANLSGANLRSATMTNTNVNNTNLSMVTQGNDNRVDISNMSGGFWGMPVRNEDVNNKVTSDYRCPSGYVISANSGGRSNDRDAMVALGFRCVQVVNGNTSTTQQDVNVLDNFSNGKYWSECGSGQAAIGLQGDETGNRYGSWSTGGLVNTGPICALFPTGAKANAPAMSLTGPGLNNGGLRGKYATRTYTCPIDQWFVGVEATRTTSDTGFVYNISKIICQTWNQIDANGLVTSGLTGTPILGLGWALQGGYLVGPGVNLSGVNLSNQDLTNVDLTNCNLTGTNLSNATLNYATANGITGSPTLTNDRFIVGGTLFGPKIGVTGATLTADTKYKQLWEASFVNSTLTNVNFEGTNFNNTYFDSSAVTTGANFYGISGYGINLSWRDLSGNNLSSAVLQGGYFNKVTIDGGGANGQNRTSGASPNMNHTNLRYATITNSTFTGNLRTVNFRGVTGNKATCNTWYYFPGPTYCNGGDSSLYQDSETPGEAIP